MALDSSPQQLLLSIIHGPFTCPAIMSLLLPTLLGVVAVITRPRQLLLRIIGQFTCLATIILLLSMLEVVALNTRPRLLLLSIVHGLFTCLATMSLTLLMLEVMALTTNSLQLLLSIKGLFMCLDSMSLPPGGRSLLSHGLGPITSPLLDQAMSLSQAILNQSMMSPCLIATKTLSWSKTMVSSQKTLSLNTRPTITRTST